MSKKAFTSVDAYVGSRVRMQRNLIGMSQEKLAELLGITFQQVQKYEKGTNRIGASRLYAIARGLGVEISYFFEQYDGEEANLEGLEQDSEHKDVSRFLASREGLALIRAFSKIENPKIRRSFVELAKTLSSDEGQTVPEAQDASASQERHSH
ncbi:helix-turn-helix transcriptional regulator [Hoeflea sp. EC-HK425]|uniref:helix-turn-helix domain-containing protein n=1 Tax=Hoeflea sp. EC-HK425 TaxID=2038388 RepID=UPI0012572DBE|nr:helix-turn-helix transcriptional regulator [Hoeflea sp. EC-HK425]VVT28210.1 Uncharacterized HTH-type transcriptional regulator Smed_0045 [Hoeflea sp. EC-HK425]